MYLSVDFFELFSLGFAQLLESLGLYLLTTLGILQPLFFQNTFKISFCLFFSLYNSLMISMLPLITILQFLEIFFHFLSLFSLCCSVSSINLASSSLILFSVISTLVSNPSSEHLFQLFFSSLISI